MSVAEGQGSFRLIGAGDERGSSGGVDVDAEVGTVDELRGGKVVDALPVRTILEPAADHIGRFAEAARSDRGSRRGGADQACAPQPSRRPGGDDTSGARRGPLHQHTPREIGGSDLDGRVGEVELERAPPAVFAHHQDIGVGHLHRDRLRDGIDQVDVARSAGKGVCGSGEGANDVDDDDGTRDVGDLLPSHEPSA